MEASKRDPDLAGPHRHATAVRPVVPSDVPALKALINATGLFPSDMLGDMLAPYFEQGPAGSQFWLTDDEGGPVAVAYYAPERMTEGTWNLYLIAVHPQHQGRGRGSALLREVEAALAGRGERVLLVETSGLPEFGRTRAFYLGNGYAEEARIRDFYQAGEDKVIFRKALGASAADGAASRIVANPRMSSPSWCAQSGAAFRAVEEGMIGFAMVGTNDTVRARGFYDPLMPLLGASVNAAWSTDTRVWYMTAPDAPMLVVTRPYDGQPATVGNGSMVALAVPSREAVQAVYAKALELGGADEGGPGHRSSDPGDLYRAYFRDPDGNKLMVFTLP